MTWGSLLADQLDFYLQVHLLPRLAGLDDVEYRWRPTPTSVDLVPDGAAWVSQTPGPGTGVPTIAWRLHHVRVCIATRTSAFGGDATVPEGTDMFDPRHRPPAVGDAAGAVARLTSEHEQWRDLVAALPDSRLLAPLGPVGGPFADDPMAALALHVSREAMHHGGEIGLLRDLYANRGDLATGETAPAPRPPV